MKTILNTSLAGLLLFAACQSNTKQPAQTVSKADFAKGSFGNDLNFLKSHGEIILLKTADSSGQVAVSAQFQGKVFTSTANGINGKSFGWINYKAFGAKPDSHINAYGGEDRLWLGPEGGRYSIFFKKGDKMEFANWHTPAALDTEPWTVESSSVKMASLSKAMNLTNYLGTELQLNITRDITILEPAEINQALGIQTVGKVKSVGFATENSITNTGTFDWTAETGAPCLWSLGMFTPSEKTVIAIPYNEQADGKVVTTDYFGQIPPDRIKLVNGILYFKADGKSRGKLGISPKGAKPIAGSFDAVDNILTIVSFDIDKNGTYLNQEWRDDKDPLTGDAVNAYNDGPLEDGKQIGPLYELESVSPAAFLKPQEKLIHKHNVFHFTGDKVGLDAIAKKVLGVSLQDIEGAFRK